MTSRRETGRQCAMKAVAACLVALWLMGRGQVLAQEPAVSREAPADAWWTGPILAPSAGAMPRGHLLFEPYFYDVLTSPRGNTAGSLSYLLYSATDRLTVGVIPTFNYETPGRGPSSTRVELGDFSLVGQCALTSFHPGRWFPATALNVQESFPTGRFDRLGSRPSDGFGAGVHTTTVSLYTQTYFWMPNGRILRTRLNLSEALSTVARVAGVSVYGTSTDFAGRAHPGAVSSEDLGLEYSLTQRWVLALDAASRYQDDTRVRGLEPNPVTLDTGPSEQVIFAPAVEYNFTATVGVIFGARVIELGHDLTRSVTPVLAINVVR